eukprot:TRINITY_DN10474_c0_g1_i1.p1 TRINITY_DN10474_c0_g1~~TRINITY_DN10474_c0_g1_i1.p1  ORF type:complete len:428 (+),score=85.73 TRINITY_DN10474_c0_g1_i1:185-1468(+)
MTTRFHSESDIMASDPWLSPASGGIGSKDKWTASSVHQSALSPSEDWSSSWTQNSASNMHFSKVKELSAMNGSQPTGSPSAQDESFFFHIRPGQRLQSWDQFVVSPQTVKKAPEAAYTLSKSPPAVLQVTEAGGEQVVAPVYSEKLWNVVPSGAPVPDLVSPTTPPSSLPTSPSKPISPSTQTPTGSPAKGCTTPPELASGPGSRRNSEIEQELQQQSLYKTELCRSWAETGACRYGTKCQFAHGVEELRPVMRHPKYKTEICRTFHTLGTCPYGTRCRFIHNRDGVLPPEWSSEIQRARSMSQPAFMTQQVNSAPQNPVSVPAAAPTPDVARSASVDYSAPVPAAAELLTQRFSQMNLAPMSWEVPAAAVPPQARASLPVAVTTSAATLDAPLEEEKEKKGKRKPRLPFFERLTVKKKEKESPRSK